MFDNPCLPKAGPPQSCAASIEVLLLRVREADHRAFRQLYELSAPRLLAKALSILGTRDAAEDALQEAFVGVWRNASQFDPNRGNGAGWLMRIVRNAAIDRLRQDRHIARYQIGGEAFPEIPVAPEPVEERLDLERSLAQLSPEQRTTICRVVIAGWTHEEVGKLDDVPTPTAKARTQRGLVRLRLALTEPGADCKTVREWASAAA